MVHLTPVEALGQGMLLGTSFAMLLYGVISMQTFLYFQNYQNDPRHIKIVVAVIWLMETLHTILSTHFIQHYFVAHFGDLHALAQIEWSLPLSSAFGLVIGWIVNMFFIARIWLLSRKPWIALLSLILATTRAVLGIYVCYLGFEYDTWAVFVVHAYPFLLSGLIVEVIVNTVITGAVSYELWQGRSGIRQTDALINRLLAFTVNTGAMTSFFAIAAIIAFVALPHTIVFLAFVYVQSKLYANCLLATLNARKAMREKTIQGLGVNRSRDVALQNVKISDPPRALDFHRAQNAIEISKETVIETDSSSVIYGKPMAYEFGQEKGSSV